MQGSWHIPNTNTGHSFSSYTKDHVCIRFVPDVVSRSGETLSYLIPRGFVITDIQSFIIKLIQQISRASWENRGQTS